MKGISWSSAAAPGSEDTPAASPAALSYGKGTQPSASSTVRNASRTGSRAGALAEQNRLFRAAAKARKVGDDEAALRYLNELLTRFPKTELAQEAKIARFRVLKSLGRDTEAAREARRYLSAHRDGPARDEARDILLDSTSSTAK